MARWDLGQLARAAGATIRGGELPVSIAAVETDTRSLSSASLFVALRGERFDGHDFVNNAVDSGAAAVVVDHAIEGIDVPQLLVEDTLQALGDFAGYDRRRHAKPLVAVTGSNGKTTTKELCAAALGRDETVHKTAGNLNNLIGAPLTLLRWPDEAQRGVIEIGMNIPGEIARLTEILDPDVGLITNVGRAHLEGLGSIHAIALAKGELFAGLRSDATAVVNLDDENIMRVSRPLLTTQKVVTFGQAEEADVRVRDWRLEGHGLRLSLEVGGTSHVVKLPMAGAHNAYNGAAAVAVALAFGLDAAEAVQNLSQVKVPGGRMRVVSTERSPSLMIIDDTYNANPDSVKAALLALSESAGGSRRLVVLGDMLELGIGAEALHHEVGESAVQNGASCVFALGKYAPFVAKGAGKLGRAFSSINDLTAALLSEVQDGDWLLVKGSRGMRMERVVEALTKDAL